MQLVNILYTCLLFVLLTPAILVRLPPNGNKWTVAFVHGLIFAIIYHLTHSFINKVSYDLEGFEIYSDPSCNTDTTVADASGIAYGSGFDRKSQQDIDCTQIYKDASGHNFNSSSRISGSVYYYNSNDNKYSLLS